MKIQIRNHCGVQYRNLLKLVLLNNGHNKRQCKSPTSRDHCHQLPWHHNPYSILIVAATATAAVFLLAQSHCGDGGAYYASAAPARTRIFPESDDLLFLPPAFRFLKYCRTNDMRCIEQNTLEFWTDLRRYVSWKQNYPKSASWWTQNHPELAQWLDSEYYRLRVYYVEN